MKLFSWGILLILFSLFAALPQAYAASTSSPDVPTNIQSLRFRCNDGNFVKMNGAGIPFRTLLTHASQQCTQRPVRFGDRIPRQNPCHDYEADFSSNGKNYTDTGVVCLKADGRWQIQD